MAPVIKELKRHQDCVRSVICVTGQHRQMLDQALNLFQIRPDYDLNLMQPNQSLAVLTGNLFSQLDAVISEVKPDWIIAQGDTTSVLVAAMTAFYAHIRFAHVEAGLRTKDFRQPFPEEMNRRIVDSLSDLCFAPTVRAKQTLLDDGYPEEQVFVTGNTVVDALLDVAAMDFDWGQSGLPSLMPHERLVLVTAHRRESFGAPLREICLALRELAHHFETAGVQFIYPVHMNPNVRAPVQEFLGGLQNFHLIEPVDYLTLVNLMKQASLILTDSGGIQEEAPSLGIPVLVMRDTTERPEGIEAQVAKLVGTKRCAIVTETIRVLENAPPHTALAAPVNPYGDGKAASRIVSQILSKG